MLRPQNFMRLHQSSRRDRIDALLSLRFDQRLPYWNPFDLLFLEPFSENFQNMPLPLGEIYHLKLLERGPPVGLLLEQRLVAEPHWVVEFLNLGIEHPASGRCELVFVHIASVVAVARVALVNHL
jgi:hypothetical protein